ncbi:MAG: SPOR domain-containing protein [Gammaproteobacteria bacterium]|nr:SPOR domain-containing protein [Gammaproteobacteria bacterium]
MTVIYQYWHKTVFKLVLLVVALCVPATNASSVVTITGLESPAWILQGDKKTKLTQDDQWGVSDQIITGVRGGVELQVGADFFLQVKGNSQVTYLAGNGSGTSSRGDLAKLSVSKGVVCIHSDLKSDKESLLVFDIGNILQATLQYMGDVCVRRTNEASSVLLWSGSVQIMHYTTGHMIVLSEVGTEFRAKDGGEYELLTFNVRDTVILESEEPANSEEIVEDEIQPKDRDEPVVGDAGKDKKPASVEVDSTTRQNRPEFEYTVYLFSSRSEKNAEKIDRKFQEAGYKTQIYEHESGKIIYYRIALPGFETRQAAEDFSQSIIGKLGVRDTWIGKARREY